MLEFDIEAIHSLFPDGVRSTAPVFDRMAEFIETHELNGTNPTTNEVTQSLVTGLAQILKINLTRIRDKSHSYLEEERHNELEVALRVLREHGVDFGEEIRDARRGLDRLVGNLAIFPGEEENEGVISTIRVVLDRVEYDHTSTRNTEASYDEETGRHTVYISPVTVVSFAFLLSQEFGQEVTTDMLKSIISYKVGHESGHVIDSLWQHGTSIKQRLSSHNTSTSLLDDFPIRYDLNDELMKALYASMVQERFAGFFAQELTLGLGRNKNTILDFNVKNLAEPYALPIDPSYLTAAVIYLDNSLSDADREKYSAHLFYIYFNLVAGNTALAGILPFSKETVEMIIADSYQKGDRNLASE